MRAEQLLAGSASRLGKAARGSDLCRHLGALCFRVTGAGGTAVCLTYDPHLPLAATLGVGM